MIVNVSSFRSSSRMLITFSLVLFVLGVSVKLILWRLEEAVATSPLASLGKIPLSFEPNTGQTDPSVRFLVHPSGGIAYFTSSGITLSLRVSDTIQSKIGGIANADLGSSNSTTPESQAKTSAVVRLQFVGANPDPQLASESLLPGKVNYFLGSNPSAWRTNIPTYSGITYGTIYPGVKLGYTGAGQQLKGTYTVAAGADPGSIRWRYESVEGVSVDAAGNLQIRARESAGGALITVTEQTPTAWQETGGRRVPVDARYSVDSSGVIGFVVGAYDKAHPLTIDPVLTYSTYLGGSGSDMAYATAVDSSGNIYIAGETTSTNFPLATSYQSANQGSVDAVDAYVTKLNSDGSALVYWTYFGGSGYDNSVTMRVDGSGNVYLTGATSSRDFPKQNPIQPVFGGGSYDGYVAKLNVSGSELVYSTYLGGNGDDFGNDIAVDSTGNLYAIGETASSNFPTANPYQPSLQGVVDVYISKINPGGSLLIYSTYLGGSGADEGFGIWLDRGSNAYLTGSTNSSDFPTQNAIQPGYGGGPYDGFITKLNAAGSGLTYSTYLGGAGIDVGRSVVVDASGNAYISGYTTSTDFPTANPIQPNNAGGYDVFVSKVNSSGSALVYSTYLGGSNNELTAYQLVGIAVNGQGEVYLTGATASKNFPTINPIQPANGGGFDGFVAKLNAAGSALIYSTYLGGSSDDAGFDVAVDGANNAYVSGFTDSPNFPTVNPYQPVSAGGREAFVARIADQPSSR